MTEPSMAMLEALSLAAQEPRPAAMVRPSSRGIVQAGAWSLLIHAILVFNAAVFEFHFPESVEAKLQFAKGERADAVEVRLSLAAPTTEPVKEPVQPQPPEALQPTAPKAQPQRPEPFEQTPPPAREPVDGGVEGRSPLADRVLPDEAAEPDAPEAVRRQEIERVVRQEPVSDVFDPSAAAPPASAKRNEPVTPAAHASKAGSNTPTPAAAIPEQVTFAAAPPSIDFTPTITAPPTTSIPPSPATPAPPVAAATTPTPATSKSAAQGVSTGVETVLVKPRYPQLSIRAGEEGIILLEIEVLADGSVGFVRVIESPGYDRLEKAAIDAVKRSKFTPALRNGTPVREVVRKSILFRLQDA